MHWVARGGALQDVEAGGCEVSGRQLLDETYRVVRRVQVRSQRCVRVISVWIN